MNKTFSDYFAQRINPLTKIDPRIKLIFVIVAIVLAICSKSPYLPLIMIFFSITSLLLIKIPLYVLFLRLIPPLCVATVVFVIQIFFFGNTPLFELHIGSLHLKVFKEGLSEGILIMSRVMGAVSLILFLTTTTSTSKLLSAAHWLKLPPTFIEIAMLTYHYVFFLWECAVTIRSAQMVRLGYKGWKMALRSWGDLVGAVIIKAYDQATLTYESMVNRGYSGRVYVGQKEGFGFKNVFALISLAMILILTLIVLL
jgi:cobalt/nickel transport system permease protein